MQNFDYIVYRVQSRETLDHIAKKLNVPKDYIKKYNNFYESSLDEGDMLYLPHKISKMHIVAPMETLDSIAKKYGITKKEILSKNNIVELFVGEKLFL